MTQCLDESLLTRAMQQWSAPGSDGVSAIQCMYTMDKSGAQQIHKTTVSLVGRPGLTIAIAVLKIGNNDVTRHRLRSC